MGIEPMLRALQAPPLPLGYRAKLVFSLARRVSPSISRISASSERAELSPKTKTARQNLFWRAVDSLNSGCDELR